ncbi:MAG: hypothetical protein LBE47_03305 [Methanomassiliicoccaceae archaeon]|jgi:hypothetical protein|nr:hypothetical protein [Methanomassiliicoccaceae archaeon]
MAKSSFDEMMVIDTPEAARNLEAAYWEAEKRGPLKLEGPSFDEILRKGQEFLKNNPDWLKRVVAKAVAEAELEGYAMEEDDTDE